MSPNLLFILFLSTLFAMSATCVENRDDYRYFGDKNSLIEWNKIDLEQWLDFDHWKKGRKRRDNTPHWKRVVKDLQRSEQIGKIISCVGDCLVIRDGTSFHSSYRTKLLEKDELTTLTNSYAWVYLLDGTVVRLSPKSSITFKEFNVGVDSFFIHARVNVGNVFWLSRSREKFKEVDKRETDAIFLPLQMSKANPPIGEYKLEDREILDLMRDKDKHLKRYRVLNNHIEKNNHISDQKRTIVWLVTPGGSLWSDFLQLDVYALFGNETFIRNRSTNYYQSSDNGDNLSRLFLYPHFPLDNYNDNQKVTPVSMTEGKWYKIGVSGRHISEYPEGDKLFKMGEFPTLRIPSILIARELWFSKYSADLYSRDLGAKDLAEVYGYRLWDASNDIHSTFVRRILFLKRHTRKNERSLLRSFGALEKALKKRGEIVELKGRYGPHFYGQALNRYLNPRRVELYLDYSNNSMNSTKKAFWRMIHEDESILYPRFGRH